MGNLERHIALKKHKDEAKELMARLVNLGNVMGTDYQKAMTEGMVEGLSNEHRTLQQGFVECLHDTMVGYSKINTDLRNEAAVGYAKQVAQIGVYFPRI